VVKFYAAKEIQLYAISLTDVWIYDIVNTLLTFYTKNLAL